MPRHYYAIRYAYAGAISDGDALARFSSQQDRATRQPLYAAIPQEV